MQDVSGSSRIIKAGVSVDQESLSEAGFEVGKGNGASKHTVDVVVIGAGPIGLLAAAQLNGTTFTHNKSVQCGLRCHSQLSDGQPVYMKEIPGYDELSDRGKQKCGNWFDSFMSNQDGGRAKCLNWHHDSSRRAQTILIGNSLAGGSWSLHHPDQYTVSPYLYMGLPDYPIALWAKNNNYPLEASPDSDRSKIVARELSRYYTEYARRSEFLTQDNIFLNHSVERASLLDGGRWEVHFTGASESHITLCDYLVVACGRTKPRQLNIPGEKEHSCTTQTGFSDSKLYVAHTTNEARRKMETIPKGGRILLIGKGMSASDVINQAKIHGHKVTHLIPERSCPGDPSSSSNVLEKLKDRKDEYPSQVRAYRLIHNLDSAPDFYEQKKSWSLEKVKQGHCLLKDSAGQRVEQTFDLVSIVIGIEADFTFLDIATEEKENLLESLSPDTMEAAIPNLFVIGMATGELFQKFSLGHAVAAAETIKSRMFD